MSVHYRPTIAKIDETVVNFRQLLLTIPSHIEREQLNRLIDELLISRGELQLRIDGAEKLKGQHL